MTKQLESFIQKVNRRKLILGSIILLIVVIFSAIYNKYLYNFVFGPFETKISDLLAINNPNDPYQYYITATGKNIHDTGFQYLTIYDDGREEVDEYYYALELGQKFILIESDRILTSVEVTGFIKPIPFNVQSEVLEEIYREVPEISGYFTPYMLKVNDFRLAGWVGISVGLAAIIYVLILFITTLNHVNHPEKHPLIKQLAAYGDPARLVREIDEELTRGLELGKKLVLTDHWLIHFKGMGFDITRCEEIVWLHKKIIQQRTHGIPIGKSYFAHIYDRNGKLINALGIETDVDSWLMTISNHVPQAVTGYTKDLDRLYKKDPMNFLRQQQP